MRSGANVFADQFGSNKRLDPAWIFVTGLLLEKAKVEVVIPSHGWLHRSRKLKKAPKRYGRSSGNRPPKRQSGKPNWDSWDKKRRTLATANARRREGLPLTRVHGKQKPKSCRKTRVVQRAIRAEDLGRESRSVQTDYQF